MQPFCQRTYSPPLGLENLFDVLVAQGQAYHLAEEVVEILVAIGAHSQGFGKPGGEDSRPIINRRTPSMRTRSTRQGPVSEGLCTAISCMNAPDAEASY